MLSFIFFLLFKIWIGFCILLSMIGLVTGILKMNYYLKNNQVVKKGNITLFSVSINNVKGLFIWIISFVVICHFAIYFIVTLCFTACITESHKIVTKLIFLMFDDFNENNIKSNESRNE